MIRIKTKKSRTHLDVLVTGHECIDVFSVRVRVVLKAGHTTRGEAFTTFIIKICVNPIENKELIFKMDRGFGKNIANSAVPVEVFNLTNLLPLRNGWYLDISK